MDVPKGTWGFGIFDKGGAVGPGHSKNVRDVPGAVVLNDPLVAAANGPILCWQGQKIGVRPPAFNCLGIDRARSSEGFSKAWGRKLSDRLTQMDGE